MAIYRTVYLLCYPTGPKIAAATTAAQTNNTDIKTLNNNTKNLFTRAVTNKNSLHLQLEKKFCKRDESRKYACFFRLKSYVVRCASVSYARSVLTMRQKLEGNYELCWTESACVRSGETTVFAFFAFQQCCHAFQIRNFATEICADTPSQHVSTYSPNLSLFTIYQVFTYIIGNTK